MIKKLRRCKFLMKNSVKVIGIMKTLLLLMVLMLLTAKKKR